MRRKKVTIAVAAVAGVLALAAGATAIAAPGGGPLGVFGGDRDDRRAEHARALGEKLGVDPARVSRAMEEVHDDEHAARRAEMAKALAAQLKLPVADVQRALDRAHEAKQAERRSRWLDPDERPDRDDRDRRRDGGPLVEALAKELNKSEAEVRRALEAVHKDRFEAEVAEAVKEGDLTERQADQIRERYESGEGRGFGPRFGGPGGGRGGRGGPGGPHGGPHGGGF